MPGFAVCPSGNETFPSVPHVPLPGFETFPTGPPPQIMRIYVGALGASAEAFSATLEDSLQCGHQEGERSLEVLALQVEGVNEGVALRRPQSLPVNPQTAPKLAGQPSDGPQACRSTRRRPTSLPVNPQTAPKLAGKPSDRPQAYP
eukprot:109441-Chlamydomonas_euryale.AAC.3